MRPRRHRQGRHYTLVILRDPLSAEQRRREKTQITLHLGARSVLFSGELWVDVHR